MPSPKRAHPIQIDLRNEERAIRRALKKAAEKARAAGIDRPEFYVECEGPSIYVMDGRHPAQINSDRYSSAERQEAIVGEMWLSVKIIGALLDVGAW